MTKKAQVKKSTGRRSIKRSKRQGSRTSHYRNVRGGSNGIATLGVSMVGTGLGGSAAYLYLRNQRKEQIIKAIRTFKEKYQNRGAYDTIKRILEDGYNIDITDSDTEQIRVFSNSNNTDNESFVSDLLRVNFKLDNLDDFIKQLRSNVLTLLIALFIKDCGFATALYILKYKKDFSYDEQLEFYVLRNNFIVGLYVQDNSQTIPKTDLARKKMFVTKYKGKYKKTQFLYVQGKIEGEALEIEGRYLFDRIEALEVKTLQCFITPGAYDSFLGSYGTVSQTLGALQGKSGNGEPVVFAHHD